MPRLTLPTVGLALVLAAHSGAAEEVTTTDRFELWNGCGTVQLVVEQLSDNAEKIGLRKEDIETAVRSRLRGARIYAESAHAYLYVNVNVVGRAYSVRFEFLRRVRVLLPFWVKRERMDFLAGLAPTWDRGSAGTHGDASGFILSGVAQHTDEFIDEYLRVNAGSCK